MLQRAIDGSARSVRRKPLQRQARRLSMPMVRLLVLGHHGSPRLAIEGGRDRVTELNARTGEHRAIPLFPESTAHGHGRRGGEEAGSSCRRGRDAVFAWLSVWREPSNL